MREPAATPPAVSVVIPTFRREDALALAVRSALTQAGVAVEVLVLDDSPEGSARDVGVLRDPRVRYVHRAVPSGGVPALVRNEGLALASGAYVHFLDDDDQLTDGALAAHVGALARTGSGVAIGVVTPVGDDPVVLRREERYFADGARRLRARPSRLGLVASMLYGRTPLINSACTIRRACAEALGGYSATVRRCEDAQFYLRGVRRFGYAFVDRPAVRYRTGAPSLMHTGTDAALLAASYQEIYRQYRAEHGAAELALLRGLAEFGRVRQQLARARPAADPVPA